MEMVGEMPRGSTSDYRLKWLHRRYLLGGLEWMRSYPSAIWRFF